MIVINLPDCFPLSWHHPAHRVCWVLFPGPSSFGSQMYFSKSSSEHKHSPLDRKKLMKHRQILHFNQKFYFERSIYPNNDLDITSISQLPVECPAIRHQYLHTDSWILQEKEDLFLLAIMIDGFGFTILKGSEFWKLFPWSGRCWLELKNPSEIKKVFN